MPTARAQPAQPPPDTTPAGWLAAPIGTCVKTKYISDFTERELLENVPLLLRDLTRRITKDNRPYALCTFSDNSGQINGVFWDIPAHIDAWLRPGLVLLVSGQVNNYRESLQISVSDVNQWLSPDMSHFLPTSTRPGSEMVAELRQTIAGLAEPWQELVAHILLDADFLPRFASAPAARAMHHACIGGLLEHTLSMAQIARYLAGHYDYVNLDLLLAGTLLHDAGKALEYDVADGFSFSDDGRLVGHIVRAVAMVEKAAAELGTIPAGELRPLVHLIASHHGTLEWGSPVVPKTLEAILLHQIDLLDSRIQGFFDHWQNDNGDGLWSVKSSYMFNTELRRPAGLHNSPDADSGE